MSAERQLERGKLEKTCPNCGRWEAASRYCSWCFRPFPDDSEFYLNGDMAQRRGRMPTTAPMNPPAEYRHSVRDWPAQWGLFPGVERGPRAVGTPVNPADSGVLGL